MKAHIPAGYLLFIVIVMVVIAAWAFDRWRLSRRKKKPEIFHFDESDIYKN